MDKIAVLIPCYNEAATVGKVVRDFRAALPEAVIYVYNNNSTDDTKIIAEREGAIVRDEFSQGKGMVIRRMFREIDAECYIMVDGDDTYPASSAREMADLVLNENADMVIGDRLSTTYFSENKRRFHGFGNKLVRGAIKGIFHNNITDVLTGYRAFSFEFVKTFPVLSRGFEIETEMTIHAVDKNMNVRSVAVEYKDRPKGSYSKLNTRSDGAKVLCTISRMMRMYRPLGFFGIIAAVLAAVAVGFFIPIFIEYFHSGLVPKFPTLIICCFTMLAAVISFFTGLTLQTILQKNRQDFETTLQFVYMRKQELLLRSHCTDKKDE